MKESFNGFMVVNGFLNSDKFSEIYKWLRDAAKGQGMSLDVYTNSELVLELGEEYKNEKGYDFCLFWDKDIRLAKAIEKAGVPTFNSASSIALCDNKADTLEALLDTDILMPRTISAPFTYGNIGYTSIDFLKYVEDTLSYPFVIKECYGSFGAQVYLAEDREAALKILQLTEGREVIFQEYVKESKGRDLRINMVGHEAVASMERFNDNDFRANITNGGSMRPYSVSSEEYELAKKVMDGLGLSFGGIDILFSSKGPMLCEANSNAHFKNIFDCTGINVADHILNYIGERLKSR